MSSYRDDLKAARSRIHSLETELEQREKEIDALLGPDAADARRAATRADRRRSVEGELERDPEALRYLRDQDKKHHNRLQLVACLSIGAAVVALAVGTFYIILALINYVVE